MDRYTEITIDGKTFYMYNEEDYNDSSTLYNISAVDVNQLLKDTSSLLPYYDEEGNVAHDWGDKIEEMWSKGYEALGGNNFVKYYSSIIDDVGILGSTFKSLEKTTEATAVGVDTQRAQVMDVSSDEELSNMIKYQNAYNASSRYINVINEMTEQIVSLI